MAVQMDRGLLWEVELTRTSLEGERGLDIRADKDRLHLIISKNNSELSLEIISK